MKGASGAVRVSRGSCGRWTAAPAPPASAPGPGPAAASGRAVRGRRRLLSSAAGSSTSGRNRSGAGTDRGASSGSSRLQRLQHDLALDLDRLFGRNGGRFGGDRRGGRRRGGRAPRGRHQDLVRVVAGRERGEAGVEPGEFVVHPQFPRFVGVQFLAPVRLLRPRGSRGGRVSRHAEAGADFVAGELRLVRGVVGRDVFGKGGGHRGGPGGEQAARPSRPHRPPPPPA